MAKTMFHALNSWWAVLVGLAIGLLGCDETVPATQVLVVVHSNLSVGSEIDELEVRVLAADDAGNDREPNLIFSLSAKEEAGRYPLPLSFSIIPKQYRSNADFRLIVTGLVAERAVVERQVRASFRPLKAQVLELFLSRRCLDILCRHKGRERRDLTCNPDAPEGKNPCEVIEELDDLPPWHGPGTELDAGGWQYGNSDAAVDAAEKDPVPDAAIEGDAGPDGRDAETDAAEAGGDAECGTQDACGMAECGTQDACGVSVECGECPSSEACVDGTCRPPESCENGIDDDRDGQADCADPECEDYACAVLPPDGWTGPLVLLEDDANASLGCIEPWGAEQYRGHAEPTSGPLTCECRCDDENVSCDATVTAYSGTSCSGSSVSDSLTRGDCLNMDEGANSVRLSDVSVRGFCTPTTRMRDRPTARWNRTAIACGLPKNSEAAGCSDGAMCLPVPSVNSTGTCVLRAGNYPCPGSVFVNRHQYFGGVDDQRECSGGTCTCGLSSNSACFLSTHFSSGCGEPADATLLGNGCWATDEYRTYSMEVIPPRCLASGVPDVAGGLEPTSPTTICCTD